MFDGNTVKLSHLCVVCVCFHATVAVLSIGNRNCKYFLTGALQTKTFTDPFFWTTWTRSNMGGCDTPPPKKKVVLGHQQGVQEFSSILTLSTWREHQIP